MPTSLRLLCIAVLLAAGCAPGPALARPDRPDNVDRPMSVDDVARLRSALEVRVSPDGGRFAWVRAVQRDPKAKGDGPAWRELRVAGRDGVDRAFVHGKVSVRHIHWTAKGDAIAYIAKRSGDKKPALWLIPAGGGESYKGLDPKGGLRGYALHPDGKRVLYVGRSELKRHDKKRAEHGFTQRIVEEQNRPWRLFIDTLRGPEGKGKKPSSPLPFELPGSVSNPVASPDGKRVALTIAPTPLVDDAIMKRQLFIVDVERRAVVGKLAHVGKLGRFWWSPDSKHLALIGSVDKHDPRAGRLWLLNAEGKRVRDLLPKYDGHVFQAAWRSPDSLVFVGHRGEQSVLDTVTIAGKRGRLKSPAGIVRSLTISTNGRVIGALVDRPEHPREVYAIDAATGAGSRITNNNPWLDQVRMGRQEVISFKARDGLRIGGVLVRPLNEKKGRRYPLILGVHGGPEAHVANGWVTGYGHPGQVAAGRGFAVFYPNYRGSTGRGVAFSMSSQSDYAGAEFNDLVDGAMHLVATGLADKARIGITGGSYGGYAAAWAATKLTKHFAAAVMFVGISDLVSKFGTTDIPNEMYLVHARRWPWKHWDYMRERSPLHHVEQGRTPLLIVHGDSDKRVHPSQSMELFRYLKSIGKVAVRLVLYKGEGHGNRRAASRYDYNLRQLRWFEHYLKGKGSAKPPPKLEYGLARDGDKDGKKGKDGKGGKKVRGKRRP